MNTTSTLAALKRYWWIVLAFLVGGGVLAGLPAPDNTADSVTRWTASHTMLVSNSSTTASIYNDPLTFNQLQLFATTGQVPARVTEAIGYNGAPAALAAQISVTAEQATGAVRISTTQGSAERAVEIADTFAEQLITYLAERQDALQQSRLTAGLARVQGLEAQVTEAETAARRAPDDAVAQAQLDALSRQYSVAFEQYNALQTNEQSQLVLTTIERAQPVAITESGLGAPRSRTGRGLLGALVGGTLGLGLAVLLARTDRKMRTREQAEGVFGMAAHVTIPMVDDHKPGDLAVVPDRHDPLSDSYRTLRSIISFTDADNDRPDGVGLITVIVSAGPGDGKTSMSANLAAAFVEAGSRTVAVNSDFRRPMLSRRLSIPHPEPIGLTASEIEHAPLELVLSPSNSDALSVLDLSPIKASSPGDLARITARMLPRVARSADVVVVDTSPVGATAEVLEFVPIADTIVVVARLGHTSIQSARRSIEMIRTMSTADIVLALMGGDSNEAGYYYYYYSSTPARPERATGRFGRKKPRGLDHTAEITVAAPPAPPAPPAPTSPGRP